MNAKLLAAGASLFGLGALFGWAITADHYEARVKAADEKVDMLRKRSSKILEIQQKDNLGYMAEIQRLKDLLESKPISETGEEVLDLEDISSEPEESYEETRSNLQSIIDSYMPTDENTEKYVESVAHSESRKAPPFVITQETYAGWGEEPEEYFDKMTLTYFPTDRILLDEDDEVVDDVLNTVGWKNLSKFGVDSNDPDVVYIRNQRLKTDFEVVRDEESQLPLHVKYGMPKEEFAASRAAGLIKLRPEDRG